MINKQFDFLQTEGSVNTRCCILNKCPGNTGHQSYIGDTCDGGTWENCQYWNAPRNPIDVKSNKSLIGVGANAAIRGKALRLRGGVSNIIIQGIHFFDLNPKHVWGGDAITLDGCDRVWIDNNKFSLVGRQFIVSGWGVAGKVTISDNEFDGRTSWSSACNGKHYWGFNRCSLAKLTSIPLLATGSMIFLVVLLTWVLVIHPRLSLTSSTITSR